MTPCQTCGSVQMVGAILAQEPKPLHGDLREFLDQALSSPHPAVYVSMGTLAVLHQDELASMVQGLSALPNPVLWKLDVLLLPGLCHTWCVNACLMSAARLSDVSCSSV